MYVVPVMTFKGYSRSLAVLLFNRSSWLPISLHSNYVHIFYDFYVVGWKLWMFVYSFTVDGGTPSEFPFEFPCNIFLESSRQADVKSYSHVMLWLTVFEIQLTVKWLLEAKILTPSPFLVSHLEAPEDVTTKRSKTHAGHSSTVINFYADLLHCTEISVTGQSQKVEKYTVNLLPFNTTYGG